MAARLRGAVESVQDVVVVDYGMGNVGSIANMFKRLGTRAVLSGDPEVVARAPKVLLPGVGAFDEAMRTLRRSGLDDALRERVREGRGPLLGVCLGMQLLLDSSEEGQEKGLGIIPGQCVRLHPAQPGRELRVPHMGWNEVAVSSPSALVPSLGQDARYYFVHSYCARPELEADVVGWTTYGTAFASAVARDDVVGLQFHPEKSHRHGLRILAEFAAAEVSH